LHDNALLTPFGRHFQSSASFSAYISVHIRNAYHSTALWICLFVDGNSAFQVNVANSETTPINWCSGHTIELHVVYEPVGSFQRLNLFRANSLCDRFERPAWTTGSLIPASFLCGIISAVLIWRGGQLTRRTKQIENTLRTALAVDKCDGLLHVPTGNTPTNSPNNLPKQTSIAVTNDLNASSEKRDDSTTPPAVSPAVVAEMTIPMIR
jgi:hypothetical protein